MSALFPVMFIRSSVNEPLLTKIAAPIPVPPVRVKPEIVTVASVVKKMRFPLPFTVRTFTPFPLIFNNPALFMLIELFSIIVVKPEAKLIVSSLLELFAALMASRKEQSPATHSTLLRSSFLVTVKFAVGVSEPSDTICSLGEFTSLATSCICAVVCHINKVAMAKIAMIVNDRNSFRLFRVVSDVNVFSVFIKIFLC